MSPHPSNTRAACAELAEKYGDFDTWFGIEQEYTFFDGIKPLGWPENGFPAPQGGYYCGVGSDEVVWPTHRRGSPGPLPREAGLMVSGINAGGDALPVGVPDRPAERSAGRRPALGGPLAAVPRGRGRAHLRLAQQGRDREAGPQAGEGRLERPRARTATSRRGRCGTTTRPASTPPRRWAATTTNTSPTTATASRSGSPDCTRRARTASTATACRTGARRCGYPGR